MQSMTVQQMYELAIGHQMAGRAREAEALYRQILRVDPANVASLSMLGALLGQQGKFAEGFQFARQATQIEPANENAWGNLAVMLAQNGQLDEAIQGYRKVLELRPDSFKAHNNLGNTLRAAGRFEEAIEAYRTALRLFPDSGEIHWNLGLVLLQLGKFEEGWQQYEGRLTAKDFPLHAVFRQPAWDGSDLAGKRILLHAEQGFGDAIQFVRYVPMVKAHGGRVILRTPRELVRLFACVGAEQVVAEDQPMPQFDTHCHLMSLPLRFGTTLTNLPANVPYLSAPPDLLDPWHAKLATLSAGLKIGLVWAGNPRYPQDRFRSIRLAQLAPLARVPGITFVSLQKGEASAQAHVPLQGMRLVDWTRELQDFADTAALISQLDLIICVDTAVAHLAGALGKRTWLLLAEPAEWRWMLNRNDSPWYPTMRLFRQSRKGDWDTVVKEVTEAMQENLRLRIH